MYVEMGVIYFSGLTKSGAKETRNILTSCLKHALKKVNQGVVLEQDTLRTKCYFVVRTPLR